MQKVLHYDQAEDFIMHEPPTVDELSAFLKGTGPGPELDDLKLDVAGGLKSDWNRKAFNIMRDQFEKELGKMRDVPLRSKRYIYDLITDSFTRLAVEWNRSQRKRKANGELESYDDVKKRVNTVKEKQGKVTRHNTRRFTVSRTKYFQLLGTKRSCRSDTRTEYTSQGSKSANLKKIWTNRKCASGNSSAKSSRRWVLMA